MKNLSFVCMLTFFCANCNQKKIRPKNYRNENVIILKQVAIDDSMNLYLYKLDGRAITVESYISYQKELCDINRDNYIVEGGFNNFTLGENDTILIWSEYTNSIDSIQPSKFHYKKMKREILEDSLFINYDNAKKIYLINECK